MYKNKRKEEFSSRFLLLKPCTQKEQNLSPKFHISYKKWSLQIIVVLDKTNIVRVFSAIRATTFFQRTDQEKI